MEFIFVKTEELKQFEVDVKKAIKVIRKRGLQLIFYSFICYLTLVSLIILLP